VQAAHAKTFRIDPCEQLLLALEPEFVCKLLRTCWRGPCGFVAPDAFENGVGHRTGPRGEVGLDRLQKLDGFLLTEAIRQRRPSVIETGAGAERATPDQIAKQVAIERFDLRGMG